MAITLPSFVAPNELIQSAWGNGVVNALDELDDEKLNLTGGTVSGLLDIHPAGTTIPLVLRNGNDTPSLRFFSDAGTDMASFLASATQLVLTTLSNNTFSILAPVNVVVDSGSTVMTLRAPTETPLLQLTSVAGTGLLSLQGSVTNSIIETFDDLTLRTNGADALVLDGATQRVRATAAFEIDGALDHDGTTAGFYGTAPIAKQTGVAVTAAAIHAALVALGLIAA